MMIHAILKNGKQKVASKMIGIISQVLMLYFVLNYSSFLLGKRGCVETNCMLQNKNYANGYWTSYSVIGKFTVVSYCYSVISRI